MQYGFLMDHDRCIGCHACTVACKSENDVPVGSFRTWVKYTEKGTFPAVRRHFAVLRCNHCTHAPCVAICPVNALEKRADGIVDLDREACIGCRACMQGCPYDAIYLNEDLGAVEKCHYCAHRIEKNLEPACVVVCPTEAIVAGDLHDPNSKIARTIASGRTMVRRPEQQTQPNVHYKGVEPVALRPGAAQRPATYIWSEIPGTKPEPWPKSLELVPNTRTVLDVGHKVQWGWHVSLYMLTKGIAAGVAMLAPLAAPLGLTGFARNYLPELVALAMTSLTTALLIADLHRPGKFLTLLTRPNWGSWLVKGAWILIAFSLTTTLTLALNAFGLSSAADLLRWVSAVLALGVAGYTAFLFGQCEGRDLWQSPLLLPHLLVQALLCGAAVLIPFSGGSMALAWILIASAAAHLMLVFGEWKGNHASENGRQAAAFLGVVRTLGVNALFASTALTVLLGLALFEPMRVWMFVPALAGLYLYEWAYVRAGQLPPLS